MESNRPLFRLGPENAPCSLFNEIPKALGNSGDVTAIPTHEIFTWHTRVLQLDGRDFRI